eukprot:gene15669-33098_t
MGAITSHNPYKFEPDLFDWKEQLNDIGLFEKDIRRFHLLFLKLIDIDSMNEHKRSVVLLNSLLNHTDVECNKLLLKFLSMFKRNQKVTGVIDNFREFCFSIWNFGTMQEKALVKDAFDDKEDPVPV